LTSPTGFLAGAQNHPPSRSLYWHYPHYHGSDWKPGAAIRDGDWKLIEFYETDDTELYNLADDMGEKNNLATSRTDVRDQLKAKLSQWQQAMNAKMPVEIASDQ
jgi:arylsulfatase A-like enzyme